MKLLIILFLVNVLTLQSTMPYSARKDAQIIAEYKAQQELEKHKEQRQAEQKPVQQREPEQQEQQVQTKTKLFKPELDHAKVARMLVSQSNWASVGTISTNELIQDYPMVNIIAIDDHNAKGTSTGQIRFMLTDLDFTGPDWKQNNKVTFMFSQDQTLSCKREDEDPMEPTCARVMISGQVKPFDRADRRYDDALVAFVQRHPAAKNWINAHTFYLCELDIQNIFVLDYYGGPHSVTADEYYNIKL